MKEKPKFSEEFISAFVDNELTPEEKAQAYAQLGDDEALNRQVCELRKVRDLVQLAYKEPPIPAKGMATFSSTRKFGLGVAAGLMLLIGGITGWILHAPLVNQTPSVAQTTTGADTQAKVLFHVSDGQAEHLKTVLDDVEDLMKYYRRSHQKARVEVIANGEGLNLLLTGISPYAERIQKMQKEYHGLTFVACQNTIDRYQQELGLTVKLLPGVVTIDSGVAQIMRRQHQGWAYLQV